MLYNCGKYPQNRVVPNTIEEGKGTIVVVVGTIPSIETIMGVNSKVTQIIAPKNLESESERTNKEEENLPENVILMAIKIICNATQK
mmetsp:Transcript_128755/g.191904  ORF Transcript_128755/g.191904 Transcript_128755/m.191904 type:complete len:87 (+) Transcript_128755:1432-1692(+)